MVERGDEKVMVDGAKIQIDKLRLTFESVERPLQKRGRKLSKIPDNKSEWTINNIMGNLLVKVPNLWKTFKSFREPDQDFVHLEVA